MATVSARQVPTPSTEARTRLHITPFHADLLDRFVPPSLQSHATNISFHTLQTFPERGFGFVELPAMEAQKLKRKFAGTTLKGAKVRIEEAKPEKAGKGTKRKVREEVEADAIAGEEQEEGIKTKKKKKKVKTEKAKRTEGIFPGYELENGRRVKRGWEDDAAKRRKAKAAAAKDEEGLKGKKGLFRTAVPPNALPVKPKASREEASVKQYRGNAPGKKSLIVKEFKHATKLPNSGKTAQKLSAVQYEDGKGWVDAEGNVVEPETAATKRKRIAMSGRPEALSASSKAPSQKPASGLKQSSEQPPESELESESEADSTSSRGLSSSSVEDTSERDSSSDGYPEADSLEQNSSPDSLIPAESSAQVVSDTNEHDATDPAASATAAQNTIGKDVHPLEALFKQSAPTADEEKRPARPARIDTSFSFFAGDEDADREDVDAASGHLSGNQPPQTPHTKQDLEWRSIRSAAPTPETAAIGKRFEFPFSGEDEMDDVDSDKFEADIGEQDDDDEEEEGDEEQGEEEEEEEEEEDDDDNDDDKEGAVADSTDPSMRPAHAKAEESEFRKWFYENRGDLNRSWKKRRREEKKLKRQRESRRLGRKLA